jgi:hypothetical protein
MVALEYGSVEKVVGEMKKPPMSLTVKVGAEIP